MQNYPRVIRYTLLAMGFGGLCLALWLFILPKMARPKGVGPWLQGLLVSKVTLPFWWVGTLGLTAALAVVMMVYWFFASRRPRWAGYQKDHFEGMVFRWGYDSEFWPTDLRCFCPVDDTGLVSVNHYNHKTVSFNCVACRKSFGPFSGDKNYFFEKVEQQINRRVRAGEWKQAEKDLW